ncbi:nidogen-2-like protein, partial [Lates japonicus]
MSFYAISVTTVIIYQPVIVQDILPGFLAPQCDDNGQYVPTTQFYWCVDVRLKKNLEPGHYLSTGSVSCDRQCHGSSGHCWCVDSRGRERTRTPPGTPPVDCDRPDEPVRPKTHCEHHRDSVQTTSPEGYPIVGAYVPQCDAEGQYLPRQCHGSSGHCWCVDSRGEERAGTRTPPGTPPVDCDKP